ncbi:Crossover junction endonuclease MUS81 [Gryllus bimaculatus]|nr:Crossover junction endonuclease MUS81 [Gryllus bimaculatus]
MASEMKRIKVKLKQPNPLFEKWLQEWRDEAAAKGSDMQYCFGKALTSLRKYPLPLSSGRDCGILQNFGNRLCVMLDRKLAEYKQLNPEEIFTVDPNQCVKVKSPKRLNLIQPENELPQMNKKHKKSPNGKAKKSSTERNVKRKSGEYIPAYRSGAYAILRGLLEAKGKEEYTDFVEKSELIKLAQPLCDTSFTRPEAGSYYTAWSSMSSLIKKGLVSSVGRGKYSLTVEGENVARKIENVGINDEDAIVCNNTVKPSVDNHALPSCSSKTIYNEVAPAMVSSFESHKPLSREENTIIFSPWSFDIILLVDTQESSGVSGRKGKCDSALNDLHKHNVPFEVRHLKIGDFTWICRERKTGQEVVLPYVIERKRIDDFAQSIMDGRFREQKFRLKQCGIPNLIYLVEKHGKECHTALPLETLNQAATNTEVTDGFIVKYAGNHKESALYLAHFSHYLGTLFMTLVVRDMFIKHLVQLNGLSVDKALAIVERYPTPYSLFKALEREGDSKCLSDIPYGLLCRKIGPVLSKSIYDLYNKNVLS